jgi:hypothetical protein
MGFASKIERFWIYPHCDGTGRPSGPSCTHGSKTSETNYGELAGRTIEANATSIILVWRFDGVDRNKLHREDIGLSFTQPPLGGHRPWFVCPVCACRRLKLYCGEAFLCRECLGLQYQSTRDCRPLRLVRRLNDLRGQLGGVVVAGELLPTRPKGMHQRTFNRLLAREAELNDQINKIEASLLIS